MYVIGKFYLFKLQVSHTLAKFAQMYVGDRTLFTKILLRFHIFLAAL